MFESFWKLWAMTIKKWSNCRAIWLQFGFLYPYPPFVSRRYVKAVTYHGNRKKIRPRKMHSCLEISKWVPITPLKELCYWILISRFDVLEVCEGRYKFVLNNRKRLLHTNHLGMMGRRVRNILESHLCKSYILQTSLPMIIFCIFVSFVTCLV